MKNVVAALLFSSLLFAYPIGPVMAGAGHRHGPIKAISSEQAKSQASKFIAKLAVAKKIDSSWAKIVADKVEKRTFSQGSEWVVTFNNNKIKDPSKRILYLFLSLGGDTLGANYTGE